MAAVELAHDGAEFVIDEFAALVSSAYLCFAVAAMRDRELKLVRCFGFRT